MKGATVWAPHGVVAFVLLVGPLERAYSSAGVVGVNLLGSSSFEMDNYKIACKRHTVSVPLPCTAMFPINSAHSMFDVSSDSRKPLPGTSSSDRTNSEPISSIIRRLIP